MKDAIQINGREAVIEYRQSRSSHQEEPKIYTERVLKALELFLEGDRTQKHDKGITTLEDFNTLEGNHLLEDTRVSNAIVELRKVIPKSGVITFKYVGEKLPRYALINDKKIIDFAEELLEEIRVKISKEL